MMFIMLLFYKKDYLEIKHIVKYNERNYNNKYFFANL